MIKFKKWICSKTKKQIFEVYKEKIEDLNKVEKLTKDFNKIYPDERIYDSQEYLNYKDSLNFLSLDPDRK